MEYRRLGRTGVRVSPLCLGAMMFGAWGNEDHDDIVRIVHRALDAGINFVDTADVYSAGESEVIVGKAFDGAGGTRSSWRPRSTASWATTRTAGQLPALDRPGLREQPAPARHRLDRPLPDPPARPECDVDETLGALTDLIRAGKVRYFGSSTFPASEIVEAQWTAERRGRERFVTEQPPYSILVRGIEADVLPTCQRYGMGVIPWSPLAGGWLTGRYREGQESRSATGRSGFPSATTWPCPGTRPSSRPPTRWPTWPRRPGLSLVHLALAFVVRHPAVSAAIIGPRTMDQLESQLGARRRRARRRRPRRIDEIVPPGTNLNPTEAAGSPSSLRWPTRASVARGAGATSVPEVEALDGVDVLLDHAEDDVAGSCAPWSPAR